jgi:hypothetical protein
MRNLCEVWCTSFLQHALLSGAKDKRILCRNYNILRDRIRTLDSRSHALHNAAISDVAVAIYIGVFHSLGDSIQ